MDKKKIHRPQSRKTKYFPGEGYGSNVIPFSGVATKRGAYGRHQLGTYLERAKTIGQKIIDGQQAAFEQRIPIPLARLESEEDPLNKALQEAYDAGLGVRVVTTDPINAHGFVFGEVFLQGDTGLVSDHVFKVMQCLVPKEITAASN